MTRVRRTAARLKCGPTVPVEYQAQASLRDQRPEKDRTGHPGANCCARRGNRTRSFSGREHKRLPSVMSGGAGRSGRFGGRQQPNESDEYGN